MESNDILAYLDQTYATENRFFFKQDCIEASEAKALLDLEKSLHIELRILTIQFGPVKLKSVKGINEKEQNAYQNASRIRNIDWWRLKLNEGITEQEIKQACSRYHQALTKLNNILDNNNWFVGQQISIVDISWYTVLQRLAAVGFPLADYKEVNHYYKKLSTRPAFLIDSKHRESKLTARVFSIFRFINKLKRNRISDYF